MLRKAAIVAIICGTAFLLSGCGSISSWLAEKLADNVPHGPGVCRQARHLVLQILAMLSMRTNSVRKQLSMQKKLQLTQKPSRTQPIEMSDQRKRPRDLWGSIFTQICCHQHSGPNDGTGTSSGLPVTSKIVW